MRRALDADSRTGQRRWTDRAFVYANYGDAELGYAVTDHTAQGRTVHTGLAVITGTEDRQHAYVALSRGTDVNLAYVFTTSPKRADPVPGQRPAPELARCDQIYPERTGVPAPVTRPAPPGTALAVLAGVLDRDGQQRSATQARNQALADADHLALLHAIWTAETTPARDQRYRDLLMSILPPGDCRELSHQARWLWRTLRAAELAGQDAGQVLAAAVGERDLAGARDLAAVLDARLRYRLGFVVPRPPGPWSAQIPEIADPARRTYLTQIAALMDARRTVSASTPPSTPCRGRSPPSARCPRIRWTGWTGSGAPPPSAPGGNCPATITPPTRSAPNPSPPPRTCGPPGTRPSPPSDLPTDPTCGACPTGCCSTCATPTRSKRPGRPNGSAMSSARSAPPHGTPGWPGSAPAPRPHAAQQRGEHQEAARKQELADSYQALRDAYRQRETVFAATMADRDDWEKATVQQRHLAVAADAELRRRYPDEHYPPLRSAEPEAATSDQREELAMAAGEEPGKTGQWIKDLAAAHRTFADRLADRLSLMIPSRDPDYGDLGQAFPPWPGPGNDAILRPPNRRSGRLRRSSSVRPTATPTSRPQIDGHRDVLCRGGDRWVVPPCCR